MPYYDDDQIDDIKTDMLYMKYITELVKPIKFNKQYGNVFDVYFQRNMLLDAELTDNENIELMNKIEDLISIPVFKYKLQTYCECFGNSDTKRYIINKASENIQLNNLISQEADDIKQILRNELENIYQNLDDENIKKIAYDVLKSAYVVN